MQWLWSCDKIHLTKPTNRASLIKILSKISDMPKISLNYVLNKYILQTGIAIFPYQEKLLEEVYSCGISTFL